jgi:hypothetical protein
MDKSRSIDESGTVKLDLPMNPQMWIVSQVDFDNRDLR